MVKSKNTNITRVIDCIGKNAGISRIEAAGILDLDKSTITKIVKILADKNIVEESSVRTSVNFGGRPKVGLSLNKNLGIIVGVDITDRYINVSVIDLCCFIKYKTVLAYDGDLMLSIVNHLKVLIEDVQKRFGKVLSLGIGIPGVIDADTGVISISKALEIKNKLNLVELLSPHFSFPIYADNDANCAAWGELMLNYSEKNFIYVLLTYHHTSSSNSLGIGLGFSLRGSIFYGDQGLAGQYQSALDKTALSGDLITDVLNEFSSSLRVISQVMNINNIVIGGEAQNYGAQLITSMQKNIDMDASLIRQPEFSFSTLGLQAVSSGAAAMAWQKLIQSPDVLFSI